MTEKILIPLDGSGSCEAAIYQVMKLLTDIKPEETTEIVLLEVVKPPVKHIPVEGGVVDIYGDADDLRVKKNAAVKYLRRTAARLKGMGIAVSYEAFTGEPGESRADTIIRAERELGGILVAMPVPVKNWFRHRAYKREAGRILDNGYIPVMMVAV